MVIDDDHDLRESLDAVLQQEGYATISFGRAADALAYLAGDGPRPALILLDLLMPQMNGWEFRERQLREPTWASIPVVATSASGEASCASFDCAALLLKPMKIEQLFEIIRQHARPG